MVVFTRPYFHIYGTRAAKAMVDLAWLAPATTGIGILIVLTGVPVYLLCRKSLPVETQLPNKLSFQ